MHLYFLKHDENVHKVKHLFPHHLTSTIPILKPYSLQNTSILNDYTELVSIYVNLISLY